MENVLGLELSENYASHSSAAMEADVSLSTRERTIVLLMGHGLTNKMIARQLSIAPETVKSHAKRIFWKLMVQTRAQAVYRASALGLLAPQMPASNPRLNVNITALSHAA
jgi:LuxR family transcriptional regulator, maltose regulon positive regulatory protein